MERYMDSQLGDIKRLLVKMGGWVEQSLADSTNGLFNRNPELFLRVHNIEDHVNQDQLDVDAACFNLLAKQAPVARDLRVILSFIKINSDLERMGDQCANIAHLGKDLLSLPPLAIPPELKKMVPLVVQMVRDCLNAFVQEDVEKARQVLLMDDEVDACNKAIHKQMIEHAKAHPKDLDSALGLILVARNLERMGDHATNVAEDIIFVSTGEDIRHGGSHAEHVGSDSGR